MASTATVASAFNGQPTVVVLLVDESTVVPLASPPPSPPFLLAAAGVAARQQRCEYAQKALLSFASIHRLVGGACGALILFYVALNPRLLPDTLTGTRRTLVMCMTYFMLAHNCFFLGLDVSQLAVYFLSTTTTPTGGIGIGATLAGYYGATDTMPMWRCLAFRIPVISLTVSLTVAYALMALDRLFETLAPLYYRAAFLPKAAWIIGIIIFSLTILPTVFVFRVENISAPTCDCVGGSSAALNFRLAVVYATLFALEVFCAITYAVILRRSLVSLNKKAQGGARKVRLRASVISVRFLIAHIFIRLVFVVSFYLAQLVLLLLVTSEEEERRQWRPPLLLAHSASEWRVVRRYIDDSYIIQWYALALGIFILCWHLVALRQKTEFLKIAHQRSVHSASKRAPPDRWDREYTINNNNNSNNNSNNNNSNNNSNNNNGGDNSGGGAHVETIVVSTRLSRSNTEDGCSRA